MENILENLYKKYLLHEVLNRPDFMEGEEINYIFKVLGRDMYDNLKYYK